ncbi:MAG: methyltransferase domain-containing protein [Gemmatimonadota bacterium]|nr:methyltransferase domain-containing protein [Gemmatimonadota bacterium]
MTPAEPSISRIGYEALDSPDFDATLTRATLRDIARANQYLGGRSAVIYGITRLLDERATGSLTMLDVGAGGGDIACYVARKLSRKGRKLVAATLDWHSEAARMCQSRSLPALVGDARALPIADGGVDLVVASQLLHHFSRDAAIAILHELTRVARLGVVVADLRRAWLARLGIWAAAHVLRFHPVSRRDGVVSVRRGFSSRTLRELLLAAGVVGTVRKRPGYRVVAFWRSRRAHN